MNNKTGIIISIIIGVASSIAPTVLLTYGMGQFNIIRIVGQDQSTWWFSVTLGIVNLSLIFLNPLSGYLFDKSRLYILPRPLWVLIGSTMGFLSMMALSYINNIILLIIFWILSSFSYGLVSLVYFVLIPEAFEKKDFGKISGLISSLIPIIIIILSIIIMGGGAFLSIKQKIISIASIQWILNALIIYLIKIPSKKQNNSRKNNHHRTERNYYPSIKKHPNFTWTLLSRLCINLTNSGLSMMTLFYMTRFELNEDEIFKIQAMTSSGALLMVLFGIISGYLSDKFKSKKLFISFSSIAMGICMCLYSISDSILFAIVLSFVYQCVFGIFNSVDLALVNQVLPSKTNHAKDIAIMNTTSSIAKSIIHFTTPTLLAWGAIWMNDDGYTLFFMVLAFFSFLSVTFISLIKEES